MLIEKRIERNVSLYVHIIKIECVFDGWIDLRVFKPDLHLNAIKCSQRDAYKSF